MQRGRQMEGNEKEIVAYNSNREKEGRSFSLNLITVDMKIIKHKK